MTAQYPTEEEQENYAYLKEMTEAKNGLMGMKLMRPRRRGRSMPDEFRAYAAWWANLSQEKQEPIAQWWAEKESSRLATIELAEGWQRAAESETRRVKGERRQVGWRIPVQTLDRLERHLADAECYPAELVTLILEKWMDDREKGN